MLVLYQSSRGYTVSKYEWKILGPRPLMTVLILFLTLFYSLLFTLYFYSYFTLSFLFFLYRILYFKRTIKQLFEWHHCIFDTESHYTSQVTRKCFVFAGDCVFTHSICYISNTSRLLLNCFESICVSFFMFWFHSNARMSIYIVQSANSPSMFFLQRVVLNAIGV